MISIKDLTSNSPREEIKQYCLDELRRLVNNDPKGEDGYFMMSPKIGKDVWTYKEAIESVTEDKPLEDSGNYNIIDSTIKYLRYIEEHNSEHNKQ
jgi:hypothetical protein